METDQKTPGQVLYEAVMPPEPLISWDELWGEQKAGWEAGAAAVLAVYSADTARLSFLMAHGSRLTDRAEIDHAMAHGDDE